MLLHVGYTPLSPAAIMWRIFCIPLQRLGGLQGVVSPALNNKGTDSKYNIQFSLCNIHASPAIKVKIVPNGCFGAKKILYIWITESERYPLLSKLL